MSAESGNTTNKGFNDAQVVLPQDGIVFHRFQAALKHKQLPDDLSLDNTKDKNQFIREFKTNGNHDVYTVGDTVVAGGLPPQVHTLIRGGVSTFVVRQPTIDGWDAYDPDVQDPDQTQTRRVAYAHQRVRQGDDSLNCFVCADPRQSCSTDESKDKLEIVHDRGLKMKRDARVGIDEKLSVAHHCLVSPKVDDATLPVAELERVATCEGGCKR